MPRVSSQLADRRSMVGVVGATLFVGALLGSAAGDGLPGGETLRIAVLGLALLPVLVLATKESLLVALFVAVYVLDGLWAYGVLPRQVSWVAEILVAFIVVKVAVEGMSKKQVARTPTAFVLVVVAVVLSLCVGLLGGQSVVTSLLGIRKYVLFPALGLSIVLGSWAPSIHKTVWRALLVVALVQVPVTIVQFWTVGGGDAAGGTLGPNGTGLVALIVTAVSLTLIAEGSLGDRLPIDLATRAAAVVALLIPPAVGSALFAFPLLALGSVLLVFVRTRHRVRIVTIVAGLLAVMAIVAPALGAYLSRIGYPDPAALFANPMLALNYGALSPSSLRPGRLDQLVLAWQASTSSGIVGALFGAGLFSASPSFFGQGASGVLLLAMPHLRFVDTSVARGMVETGIVGVLAWTTICLDCGRRGYRLYRSAQSDGHVTGGLGMAVGYVLLVAGFYNDAWHEPATALMLWATYAIVVRLDSTNPYSAEAQGSTT